MELEWAGQEMRGGHSRPYHGYGYGKTNGMIGFLLCFPMGPLLLMGRD